MVYLNKFCICLFLVIFIHYNESTASPYKKTHKIDDLSLDNGKFDSENLKKHDKKYVEKASIPEKKKMLSVSKRNYPYQYPWMAIIQYRNNNTIVEGCGGSLVNSRFILTAAHCVDNIILKMENLELYGVLLGDNRKLSKRYEIDAINIHEKFETFDLHNDIALIKLNREVVFNDYIQPIYLPLGESHKENRFLAMARRTTNLDEYEPGKIVRLAKIHQEVCIERGVTLTEGQLCLGNINNVDICRGDSGKPIILETSANSKFRDYQIGLMSYGFDKGKCGKGLSVVTFVPYYLEWIQRKIK